MKEKFEEDMDWIKGEIQSATEEECEAFAEKVALLMADQGYNEKNARLFAKSIMFSH